MHEHVWAEQRRDVSTLLEILAHRVSLDGWRSYRCQVSTLLEILVWRGCVMIKITLDKVSTLLEILDDVWMR